MDSATIRVAGINGRGDRIRYGSKLFGLAVAMLFVFQYVGLCRAETIAAFQGEPTSGTSAATVDNASGDYPIVTYILSQPIGVQPGGPNGGFARYVFLAQDSTGSIDYFGNTSASTGYPGIPSPGGLPSGYVPAVGDKISFTAQNRPFNGVSEASPSTTSVPVSAISVISHSNPVPYSPVAVTIPDINTGVAPVQSITAHLVTVSGVNIIHAGPTFGSAA